MNLPGIFLVGFLAQSVTAPQVRPASIEGFVIKAGTGEPISKANVTVSAASGSARSAVVTAADGRFVFLNLGPGSYRITVTRNGYLDGAYGKRGPNGSGASLPIAAGQAIKDVHVSMIAMGAISGRILDFDGEPAVNVPVQALKYSYVEGQRILTQVKAVETDDRGEYRLFWLPPGQYYVRRASAVEGVDGMYLLRVVPNGLGRPMIGGADAVGLERWAPVYFPGTIDVKSAAPIDLRSGADYGGVDFTFIREKGRQLRGVLFDANGRPARASISLTRRDRTEPNDAAIGGADIDGQFTITGVLPGSYVLSARSRVENERQTGGHIFVDVGDANIDGLVVALSPSIDIEGRLVVEGLQAAAASESRPVITLESRNSQGKLEPTEGAQFSDNVSFRMPGVVEGDYQVRVYQLRPDQYIKSVRSGSIDVLSNGLRVESQPPSVHLDVVIGANAGSIEGVVANDKHEPQSDIKVTLIPDAASRQRDDVFKVATTNESGRFQMQGIAPGTYTLLAWDDIEDGAWLDPDFMRRFESRGTRVRVDEGSKLNVEISPTTTN